MAKQLKKFKCDRFDVVYFVYCYTVRDAAKLLKTTITNLSVSDRLDTDRFNIIPNIVYRQRENIVEQPTFSYTKDRAEASPNSLLYYTSRGLSETQAHKYLKDFRSRAGGLMTQSKDKHKTHTPSSLEFWLSRGYSLSDATHWLQEFQKKSLLYFQHRYGDVDGLRRYNKCQSNRVSGYVNRQKTELANIQRHLQTDIDSEWGEYKQRRNSVSPRTVTYWINRGHSRDQAISNVRLWQSEMSPRSVNYWIKQGYCEEQAKLKVSEFQAHNSLKSISKRYNCTLEVATDIQESIYNKIRETKASTGLICSINDKADYLFYSYQVRKFTEKVYKLNRQEIDPCNIRSSQYHLDHKFSILSGFLNSVPVKVIASKVNLHIIDGKQNLIKKAANIITLEELYAQYEYSTKI